jgi:hypothetical protein
MRTIHNLRKTSFSIVYFGIPILVALCSVVFPVGNFLRQAMVGFVIIWCLVGSWLL